MDFHALRVTFGTLLAKQGVPIQTAKVLMRHTDIRLTTNIYTDASLLDTDKAVNELPDFLNEPVSNHYQKKSA
jgi:integrase